MCIYITMILPQGADLPAIQSLARAMGRELQPQPNASLARQIAPGEAAYTITGRSCDCDTSLGYGKAREAKAFDRGKAAEKLRARGWSAAKIARSLAEKADHLDSDRAQAVAVQLADVQRWQRLLEAILGDRHSPHVGLLLHMYRGTLDEDIVVRSRAPLDVSVDALLGLAQDAIHEFRAAPTRQAP